MTYSELTPAELFEEGAAGPGINERSWLVRWDLLGGDAEQIVYESLPAVVDFHTSGTTGPSQCWRRTRDQLWAEAGLLADLVRQGRPEAIVSFAPPRHLYGALTTLLLPVRLGIPVWYRPQYFGEMPKTGHSRLVIVAVPWTFSILRRHASWVSEARHLTVLHSTATLPAIAGTFLSETRGGAGTKSGAGEDRVRLVEVFGSTEAGGIATRDWTPGDVLWRLLDDVEFAEPPARAGEETPLVIRSPRLAFRPGEEPAGVWQTDDFVEVAGERSFRFAGRRSRLVKINGRRVNLDDLEHSARAVLRCADLAFLPVEDAMSGEHLDLLVASEPGTSLSEAAVRSSLGQISVRPRQVHLVDRIDRTDTGKLRRVQRPLISAEGGET
ncbi:class I adenylate-forming enzyme family protein [Sinosporangium siamense]|uniref:Acyl-CoA synthetase (AMP-forming)/AMP-acid ligase II n=1 Tax=Sinosporangium siamense TaxID=1367973 RepID=A0A919RB43_9ACTN|nr:class I adenylate-forming enzyme family protein [Sinosporangium siamense]GII90696.1 hypothetical protein Ssi02_09270 [Sinosporangium siamense]